MSREVLQKVGEEPVKKEKEKKMIKKGEAY